MKIHPLNDRVLVKRKTVDDRTPGGLVIPQNAQQKPMEGEVVAVGRGRWLQSGKFVEPTVKVGDRVLFARFGGQELPQLGDDHVVLREEDILAVLEP